MKIDAVDVVDQEPAIAPAAPKILDLADRTGRAAGRALQVDQERHAGDQRHAAAQAIHVVEQVKAFVSDDQISVSRLSSVIEFSQTTGSRKTAASKRPRSARRASTPAHRDEVIIRPTTAQSRRCSEYDRYFVTTPNTTAVANRLTADRRRRRAARPVAGASVGARYAPRGPCGIAAPGRPGRAELKQEANAER